MINIKTSKPDEEAIYISTGWFNKGEKRKWNKYAIDSSIEEDNYDFSQT